MISEDQTPKPDAKKGPSRRISHRSSLFSPRDRKISDSKEAVIIERRMQPVQPSSLGLRKKTNASTPSSEALAKVGVQVNPLVLRARSPHIDHSQQIARGSRYVGREGQTMQPTALANEAYLLFDRRFPVPVPDEPENRHTFFRTVSMAMRTILRDYWRERG